METEYPSRVDVKFPGGTSPPKSVRHCSCYSMESFLLDAVLKREGGEKKLLQFQHWCVLVSASVLFALADFCSTLRASGRDVPDVSCQMSPILHALDDGDDPHEVPEQLVQFY